MEPDAINYGQTRTPIGKYKIQLICSSHRCYWTLFFLSATTKRHCLPHVNIHSATPLPLKESKKKKRAPNLFWIFLQVLIYLNVFSRWIMEHIERKSWHFYDGDVKEFCQAHIMFDQNCVLDCNKIRFKRKRERMIRGYIERKSYCVTL